MKTKYWLDPSPNCRNCGTYLPDAANYCPQCSQRNTTGKIKLWEFLKEAFSNLFNIDSKFFKTIISLVIPGKLTNEFFVGKHQSFASPVRMFFVTMILFIAALSFSAQEYIMDSDFLGLEYAKTRLEFRDSITTIKEAIDLERLSKDEKAGMDSLYNKLMEKIRLDVGGDANITFESGKKTTIKKIDILKMTPDELIEKYEIEGFFAQTSLKQFLKLNKNPKSLVGSIFGNLTLMFLLLMPCMALVFKILYIRRDRYFVEHLVFLFHFHAFILFVSMVFILLSYKKILPIWLTVSIVTLIGCLYLIAAINKVYQQKWWKTIWKFFFIGFSYLIVLTFCFSIISMISFLIF